MAKRTIQTSRPGRIIGIEHDHLSIRCAQLTTDGRDGFSIDRLEELKGDFASDSGLLEGYRALRNTLGIGARDPVVTCLAGKQVFAAELEFRKLGGDEMEQALRLELRKTVHFEVATSTLDFQILDDALSGTGSMVQVLVALAANSVLKRETGLLERAGMKAMAVDVLPIAIANSLWAYQGEREGNAPWVGLHVGPQISTIVIDSEHYPFFNRNIYFAAEEAFGPNANPADREKRIQQLADEVSRSLLFYEKNSQASGFQEILLLGDYLESDAIAERVQRICGLAVRKMDLPGKLGPGRQSVPGRFDLAVGLALRGER
jgi:Tfp pilus assembly PilM family ATPase